MTTSMNKYADYKIAPPPLERRRLPQGKLRSSSERAHDSNTVLSILDQSSSEGLESSPRRPPIPHTTAGYPTKNHTHSELSLSDSDSPPPSHTTTAVIPHSSSSVVMVRAQDYSPSHSQPVKTTSTKTLSPVKVTRHVYNDDEEVFDTDITAITPPDPSPPARGHDWKRFSSSFVTAMLPIVATTEHSRTKDNGVTARQGDTQPLPRDQQLAPVTNLHLPTETSADLDSTNDRTRGEDVEHEAVGGRGVGRSASDHGLKRVTEQENLPAHSKSVDMGKLASAKKKATKGRAVASRYMSASSSTRKPPLAQSGRSKATPLKSGTTAARKSKTVASKPPLRKPPDAHKPPSRVKASSTAKQVPTAVNKPAVPSTPGHNTSGLSMSFSPSGMVTSTPTHPTGGGNDGSFIVMDTIGNDSYTAADTSKKQTEGTDKIDELEYLHTRLLQATRLNVMSALSLKAQDQEAKCQLYSLWKALEDKKVSNLEMMKSLETERRNLALDKTLDLQLQGLGPVVSTLTQLERSYAVMARALDSTRHDLTLKGLLPVNEGQLTEELAESEELLGDIMTDIRGQVQQVASYAESADEVVTTLKKELDQLESCWDTLESVTKLQLHEASLYLEDKHRTRT